MQKIVNDFCITFSNVNGTGSSTANTAVMRALFKMGIPVSGRNVFPSNIKGLPTWFTVRVSKNGYLGRVAHDHVLVLMNESTIEKDLEKLAPGGLVLYDARFKVPENAALNVRLLDPGGIIGIVEADQVEVPHHGRLHLGNQG